MSGYDIKHDDAYKYSLGAIVFNRIREDILGGVYNENDELREVALAHEIGVSRTPVREALRQLELEGLVNIIPNKGAYVVGITHKDVRDIYLMRSLLEGLCAGLAAQNCDEEMLGRLEGVIDLSEYYCGKNKADMAVELDNQFHSLMYEASGSKMLKHTLSDFHHYLEGIRKTTLTDIHRADESNREHRAILDAVKEKDAKKAEQLAHEHIINAMQNIEEHDLW